MSITNLNSEQCEKQNMQDNDNFIMLVSGTVKWTAACDLVYGIEKAKS